MEHPRMGWHGRRCWRVEWAAAAFAWRLKLTRYCDWGFFGWPWIEATHSNSSTTESSRSTRCISIGEIAASCLDFMTPGYTLVCSASLTRMSPCPLERVGPQTRLSFDYAVLSRTWSECWGLWSCPWGWSRWLLGASGLMYKCFSRKGSSLPTFGRFGLPSRIETAWVLYQFHDCVFWIFCSGGDAVVLI